MKAVWIDKQDALGLLQLAPLPVRTKLSRRDDTSPNLLALCSSC
jgi:hypothetical protein